MRRLMRSLSPALLIRVSETKCTRNRADPSTGLENPRARWWTRWRGNPIAQRPAGPRDRVFSSSASPERTRGLSLPLSPCSGRSQSNYTISTQRGEGGSGRIPPALALVLHREECAQRAAHARADLLFSRAAEKIHVDSPEQREMVAVRLLGVDLHVADQLLADRGKVPAGMQKVQPSCIVVRFAMRVWLARTSSLVCRWDCSAGPSGSPCPRCPRCSELCRTGGKSRAPAASLEEVRSTHRRREADGGQHFGPANTYRRLTLAFGRNGRRWGVASRPGRGPLVRFVFPASLQRAAETGDAAQR